MRARYVFFKLFYLACAYLLLNFPQNLALAESFPKVLRIYACNSASDMQFDPTNNEPQTTTSTSQSERSCVEANAKNITPKQLQASYPQGLALIYYQELIRCHSSGEIDLNSPCNELVERIVEMTATISCRSTNTCDKPFLETFPAFDDASFPAIQQLPDKSFIFRLTAERGPYWFVERFFRLGPVNETTTLRSITFDRLQENWELEKVDGISTIGSEELDLKTMIIKIEDKNSYKGFINSKYLLVKDHFKLIEQFHSNWTECKAGTQECRLLKTKVYPREPKS